MKILDSILKNKNQTIAFPVEKESAEEPKVIPVVHDYGLSSAEFVLKSNDFGWKIKPHKKVTLVNSKQCENRVSVFGLVSAWKGTKHPEWEYLLAAFFINSLLESLEKGEDEADITDMFNRDFTASNNKIFAQEDVFEHIIGWFDVISENDEEMRVALRV